MGLGMESKGGGWDIGSAEMTHHEEKRKECVRGEGWKLTSRIRTAHQPHSLSASKVRVPLRNMTAVLQADVVGRRTFSVWREGGEEGGEEGLGEGGEAQEG